VPATHPKPRLSQSISKLLLASNAEGAASQFGPAADGIVDQHAQVCVVGDVAVAHAGKLCCPLLPKAKHTWLHTVLLAGLRCEDGNTPAGGHQG